MSELVLSIGGTRYGGWLEANVTRSIERLAATFSVTMTDRWKATDMRERIAQFDPCTVTLDRETVLEGIIEDIELERHAGTHSVVARGHSRPGELERAAAELPGGELTDIGLAGLARKLCQPLGVSVINLADATADQLFARAQVEPGETGSDILAEHARQRGLFLTDDARGRLVIRRRGKRVVDAIDATRAHRRRAMLKGDGVRSSITVKGQRQGSDRWDGKAAAEPSGQADDPSVLLHRPHVTLAERQGDSAAFRERARFALALRRGKSRRWTFTLPSWRDTSGNLWQPGELYRVSDPWLRLDRAELVLAEADWSVGAEGTVATLTFGLPEGFDLPVEIPPVRRSEGGWNE